MTLGKKPLHLSVQPRVEHQRQMVAETVGHFREGKSSVFFEMAELLRKLVA